MLALAPSTQAAQALREVARLGARFDGAVKRWYVDEGSDLAMFA